MSDTIWLELSDGRQKTGGDRDNSAMLRLSEDLDALATKLGVAKLTTFYDSSALAEEYADEFEGADMPAAESAWFEASAGRESVAALLGALRENPKAVQADSAGGATVLIEELEYCHGALIDAERRGQRFHLLIVP
jgi:hypothetical protein